MAILDKFFISSGPSFGGTFDADAVFNWGRSLNISLPPSGDVAKGINVNDGGDGATGGSAICAAGVDKAFSFLFLDDRRQSPP